MSARRSISTVLVWLCAVAGVLVLWSAPALAQRKHVYSTSFGSEGSGDGQLSRPGALAVSEVGPDAGDVYVVDRGNGRVEIFSATGAYVGQFNGSASPTGAFSWPTQVKGEAVGYPVGGGIAVDNSTNPLDPSAGDVYVIDMGHEVIDKFSPSGAYIGQLTEASVGSHFTHEPFEAPTGVAVDANGMLWVEAGGRETASLFEFDDASANEFISERQERFRANASLFTLGDIGLAFDSEGNSYIGQRPYLGLFTSIAKFSSANQLLAEQMDSEEEATGVAVDRSSNNVYIDNETSVAALDPSESLVERFGSPQMGSSEGIAVDSSTGTVYTSNTAAQAIDVFTALVVPDVTTGTVSNLGERSATVRGAVDPDGLTVSSCVFEYGTTTEEYGRTAACSPSPGSGSGSVAVSANLSGLEPLTHYHFRLRASNANGSNTGRSITFLTPLPVAVSEEGISDVSSDSAQFSALVNPGGSDTTFRFEYGTSISYGQSVPAPDGDLGAGTEVEPVNVRAQGLQPETTYHVRFVATNTLGTVYGPDQTFTTQAGGGAFELPDHRAWEMVSPPNNYGAGIESISEEGLVEAAENGSAIAYLANAPIVASPAGNPSPAGQTQVLSRREGGGWSSEDIATPHDAPTGVRYTSEYVSFSSDLSQALVEPEGETPLSSQVTEKTVYLRNDKTGEYLPLVTARNVPEGTKFGNPLPGQGVNAFIGTPDLSHILLESPAALTSNAVSTPREGGENIYEWVHGQLTLVNILPKSTVSSPEGALLGGDNDNLRHALSNDGSRVFWEYVGNVYMRNTVTGETVQVDAPAPGVPPPPAFSARFEIASATGSKAFFLDDEPLTADSKLIPHAEGPGANDLYVFDTETQTLTDLSVDRTGSEPANVQNMVLGAAENGSIVYFVGTGVLAEGAQAGADNLYVASETGSTWSAPRLVAVLSPEDKATWGSGSTEINSSLAFMASKVSPNGRFLAFMSDRSLTGYDNRDANSGEPDEEVFLYDEASGHLTCVSCNPTGARPTGVVGGPRLLSDRTGLWDGGWLAAILPTGNQNDNGNNFSPHQPRYLSDEGRLFFDSFDSLVAQDTNGQGDVYEYEPEGVGSCEVAGGCVSLISSGTSGEESSFLDASGMGPGGEEGEDAFFVTTSRLAPQDYDTSYDVYDAHVCSTAVPCVNAPVSPPACSSGDSCKAAPAPQPPIFGAPASATFSGAGNLSFSQPATVGPKKTSKGGRHKPVKHKQRKRKRRRSRMRRSFSSSARSASKGGER